MSQGRLIWVLAAVLILVAGSYAAYRVLESTSQPAGYIDPSDARLVIVGKPLYEQHCASCHGAKMEGQPNWRIRMANGRLPAPPHDDSGHTWHHSDQVLLNITLNGLVPGVTAPPGYQSDMPAYKGILSESRARAVLAYIKTFWSEQSLKTQREITRREQRQ